ncbi:hypothetical protein CC78DRAFT_294572 [Lojkania enalia]|uniref:Uncharacterized protein n=1 Tax=Lojkania enalia TaxID=147567 RepID=A0A9P4K4S4_9PLEO|nr:hypothetical protein CC78DRAFT_294572 [Didymosphaeria enalia]
MPPKRKHKATQASAPAPQPKAQPADAGGIRTSSVKRRPSALPQGQRTSRLQPSEPLHMTTRRASRAASNNTSPAAPSSTNGSSSRRSSLNTVTNIDDLSDHEDEPPSKRIRTNEDSGSPPGSMGSSASQISVVESQTPAQQNAKSRVLSTRKRRASRDSSQSSKTISARQNGVPARSESEDISEQQLRRKKRKTNDPPQDPAEAPPELTDASTPAGSPEQIPDVESSQGLQHVLPIAADDAPTKVAKRLPGRRRQPHPDVNVETDLRRQLQLKMSYRVVAKTMKKMLDELSNRTINHLETDPEYHKQFPEYQAVLHQLQDHYQIRMDQIDAERELKLQHLERVHIAQERIQHEQFINCFKDLQEDMLLQCAYQLKQLEREMKMQTRNGTDDEDNIVEPTHTVDFPARNEDDRLGSKFASRSRAYVEVERLVNEVPSRRLFDKLRKEFVANDDEADDSLEDLPGGFATFTGPDRTDSTTFHNIASLLEAAADIDRALAQPEASKVIPNEQADALFLLASLSSDQPQASGLDTTSLQHSSVPSQVATPTPQPGLHRPVSPFEPVSKAPSAVPLETVQSNPAKLVHENSTSSTPSQQASGITPEKQTEPKQATPARLTSHRISDILNNDDDLPIPKPREPRPFVADQAPVASPSLLNAINQHSTPSNTGPLRLEAIVNREEREPNSRIAAAEDPGAGIKTESPSLNNQYWLSKNIIARNEHQPEHTHPKPSAIDHSRERLDSKKREHVEREEIYRLAHEVRETSGFNSDRRPSAGGYTMPSTTQPPYTRSTRDPAQHDLRNNAFEHGVRSQWDDGRSVGVSHTQQSAPPSTHYDPTQHHVDDSYTDLMPPASAGSYTTPGAPGPQFLYHRQHYNEPPASKPSSQGPSLPAHSHGPPQDPDHRQSPNVPQVQLDRQPSLRQPHMQSPSVSQRQPPGQSPSISHPPLHGQSPNMAHAHSYSQSHAPQQPQHPLFDRPSSVSFGPGQSPNIAHAQQGSAESQSQRSPRRESLTQPQPQTQGSTTKPPPVNYRFAHYDPAPVRSVYPPPPPGYERPKSHPNLQPAPPPHHYPNPYGATAAQPPPPPPPPQPAHSGYGPSHGAPPQSYAPSSYPGYVPPPGSFQAPPPPPISQQYPPLKIEQYGGQPILPANMAPPPGQQQGLGLAQPPPPPSAPSTPLASPYSQATYSQGYVGVPLSDQGVPMYDMPSPPRRNRPPTPQPRPRRQYRAYHAPGTQFRSYQGPESRRRPNNTSTPNSAPEASASIPNPISSPAPVQNTTLAPASMPMSNPTTPALPPASNSDSLSSEK